VPDGNNPEGKVVARNLRVRDPFGNTIEFIQPSRIVTPIDRPPQPKVHLSVALLHEKKILLVREGKPSMLDKWNLPGGHAEKNEFAIDGALRELLEETGLDAKPTSVLGLFSTPYSVRLVITAEASNPKPVAGDDVLEARFWSIGEAKSLDDSHWINPVMIRQILDRIERGVKFPLDVVSAVGF
ncbi:MAG TPA: NUDIX domain-containing protein, partial [Tepidisphaeraceae bacterium]|nr:NUDIX domain-containing protein [Tepidisphaeraceae bacterium]